MIPITDLIKVRGAFNTPNVYHIMNIANRNSYVGSTSMLASRVMSHFGLLKRNIHYNRSMQRDFNLWGIHLFEVGILFRFPNNKNVRVMEREFIKSMQPYYNIKCK
jgi:group I intron endonuclease